MIINAAGLARSPRPRMPAVGGGTRCAYRHQVPRQLVVAVHRGAAPAAVARIGAPGVTVRLVEQRLAEALEIADRAYVLQTERVVMSGPARQIAADADMRRVYPGM